jgi:hypothetical protein
LLNRACMNRTHEKLHHRIQRHRNSNKLLSTF